MSTCEVAGVIDIFMTFVMSILLADMFDAFLGLGFAFVFGFGAVVGVDAVMVDVFLTESEHIINIERKINHRDVRMGYEVWIL